MSSVNQRWLLVLRAVVLCIVMAFFTVVLVSCGEENNDNGSNSAKNAETPNLTSEQVNKIYGDIITDANEYFNNAETTDEALSPRFSSNIIPLMSAWRIALKANATTASEVGFYPNIRQMIISKSIGWPRTTFLITQDDANSISRLVSITQNNVYENYKVDMSVRVFENVELPKFDVAKSGIEQVSLYDKSLKYSILDTASEYAGVLQDGASSVYANRFLIDKFQTEMRKNHSESESQLVALGGSSNEVFTLQRNNIVALRTYDLGALVVATYDSTWTRSGSDKVFAVATSPAEKALSTANGITSKRNINVNYVNYIAFYIPPLSGGDDITVLGGERFPYGVSTE